MKVMQLLPDLNQGGVERGTIDISRALSEAGHESVVISGGGRLVPELEAHGARHIVLPIGRKAFATLLIWWRLLGLLKSERPDIVHLRSRLPAWVFWVAYRFLPLGQRPRVVTTLHGMNSVSRYSQVMLRGDHLIAVSQTCLQYWRDHYPAAQLPPHSVIYRGIDTEFFRETPSSLRSELGAGKDTLVIAFPGRITPWKGHRDLIGMVKELAAQDRDFQVWVVGEAKPGSDFEREIRAASSELPQIKFLGHRSDMPAVLSAADVTLSLTSTTMESFGRGPVESIACGTPVIAFDHGAVGETLRALQPDGLVKVGDIQAVVAKLSDLPAVPNSIEPFTLSQMRALTLDVYQDLMRQPILEVLSAWGRGGLESHFEVLTNAMAARGEFVAVLVPVECDAVFDSQVQVYRHDFSGSRFSPNASNRLRERIQQIRPRIIHTHAGKASALVSKIKHEVNVPWVATVHNQKSSMKPYRLADAVIGVSQRLAKTAGANGRCVYNGTEATGSVNFGSDLATRWLAVGRLVKAKGFDVLLEAISTTSIQLDIAGDGPEMQSLEDHISRLGLGSQVRLLGAVNNVQTRMPSYRGVVVSSRREGFSYVVAEALLQSVPVVSTRVPVADEVLPEKFLSRIEDPVDLRRILSIADQDSAKLAVDQKEAFRFARRHFTKQAMVDGTLSVFQQVLSKSV